MTLRSIALFATLVGCAASADGTKPAPSDVPELDSRMRVEVAVLGETTASLELSLTGEVEASRDARLASALGGYVERVNVADGDTVRSGQLIVAIDAEIYAAQRDQAAAQLDLATSELARLEKLGDLATPSQLHQARTQVALAEASQRQSDAQLRRARVTAPFSGVVAGLEVERGEVASPGAPLARVVTLDPITVSVAVSDRDIVSIRPGTQVQVTTSARGELFQGEITHVAPAADPRTRAFEVEARVANPDHLLLPGMIARVGVSSEIAAGLVIPQEWIITRFDERGVFLARDGQAVWQPVELGEVVRDQVFVNRGLDDGARIIITGHRSLLDGDPILVAREGTCCTRGRVAF